MTPRLPQVNAKTLIRALEKKGFALERQSGSHAVFIHPDGRRTTVPIHAGRDIGCGLLRRIMRDTGISVEDM